MKVAIVTGSGKRRIGWHVAEAARRPAATRSMLHYRSSATEVGRRGRGAPETRRRRHRSQGRSHRRTFGEESRRAGDDEVRPDRRPRQRGRALAAEAARRGHRRRRPPHSFDTNLLSTFCVCSQQAGLAMVQQPEGGVIVNIGDWAIARPYLDYAAYFPSKGAIPTLTRTLAVELGSRNPEVRVNAILPGPVMLPPDMPEAERRHAIEATLVKREGRPEHIAQAVAVLRRQRLRDRDVSADRRRPNRVRSDSVISP